MPDEFWEDPVFEEATAERHFGTLLLAYRKVQRPEPTQALVGQWLGLTQGQVSRIERSAVPVHDLDKLDRWAQALQIPQSLLWFNLTAQPSDAGVDAEDLPSLDARLRYDEGTDAADACSSFDGGSIVQASACACRRRRSAAETVHQVSGRRAHGSGSQSVGWWSGAVRD